MTYVLGKYRISSNVIHLIEQRNSIFIENKHHIKLKFAEGGGVKNNNPQGENNINSYIVRAAQS